MYVMTITRNGETQKVLASGWTYGETQTAQRAYEKEGWTVTFAMEVWR